MKSFGLISSQTLSSPSPSALALPPSFSSAYAFLSISCSASLLSTSQKSRIAASRASSDKQELKLNLTARYEPSFGTLKYLIFFSLTTSGMKICLGSLSFIGSTSFPSSPSSTGWSSPSPSGLIPNSWWVIPSFCFKVFPTRNPNSGGDA